MTIFSNTSKGQEILWDSTFVVDHMEFKVLACRSEQGSFAQLLGPNSDTLTIKGVAGRITIFDYNQDGFLDVSFSYLGNFYSADLYLYNEQTKAYQQLEGFPEVSDSEMLRLNPNYFYSYRPSGCADMNWISKLFYIEDFKIYVIGEIHAKGCISTESPQEIEVLKIAGLDKVFPIERLPIDTLNSFDPYKRGFLDNYWHSNFAKFKNPNTP